MQADGFGHQGLSGCFVERSIISTFEEFLCTEKFEHATQAKDNFPLLDKQISTGYVWHSARVRPLKESTSLLPKILTVSFVISKLRTPKTQRGQLVLFLRSRLCLRCQTASAASFPLPAAPTNKAHRCFGSLLQACS